MHYKNIYYYSQDYTFQRSAGSATIMRMQFIKEIKDC